MAPHNNLKLLLLFFSLLIPLHLAQPEVSPNLPPGEASVLEPILLPSSKPASVPTPYPGPASVPSPFPGPTSVPSPSPELAPRPTPSSGPSPSPNFASVPPPSPGPAPIPSPFLGPAPRPMTSSGLAPEPSPSSEPTSVPPPSPGPALVPSPSPGPASMSSPSLGPAPGPLPSSGPSLGSTPSSRMAPGQSPSLGTAPGPSPSISDTLTEFDVPSQFDFSPVLLAPSTDVDPKVKKICDSTDHPSLCLATVVPLLNGKTDVSSVLNVAIRAGAKISRYGQFLAQKLAGKPGNSPELASILNDCMGSYDTAVDNYENAIDAFPEHDIGTMKSMLSAVITNVGDCEDAFSKNREDSPFSSIGVRLRNMTSNCLAIVSLLN